MIPDQRKTPEAGAYGCPRETLVVIGAITATVFVLTFVTAAIMWYWQ